MPEAPTKEPHIIRAWPADAFVWTRTNPVKAAAIPEYEFNSEITTGISAPPIGITSNIPSNADKPIIR